MTDAAILVEALAEQLEVDMNDHLFVRPSGVILWMKVARLEERFGRRAVRAALKLRYRQDRAEYWAELKRQKQTSV
jgi:hypothetical protein